ncbi:MAG: hypothetical protein ACE15E_03325 [Acidobacteriota bacterium]
MSQPERTNHHLTREEIAQREVGHTSVTPAVSRFLVFSFLLVIVAVPVANHVAEGWRQAVAGGEVRPTTLTLFDGFPALDEVLQMSKEGPVDAVFEVNRRVLAAITSWESALRKTSATSQALLPAAQNLISGYLGGGNEKAYCGADGWFFYRPEIEYLTGPGFLEPRALLDRLRAAKDGRTAVQPDPTKAILEFNRFLARQGIRLVVMPVPIKPVIYPERFANRALHKAPPLQNASFGDFKARLEAAGIAVLDLAPSLVEEKKRGANVYLATATHWTPAGARVAALWLAALIRSSVPLPAGRTVDYRKRVARVSNVGDTARMIGLPVSETVEIEQVLSADGQPWAASPQAQILCLGDSFSNIDSLRGMGWGESAGLVEHLSAELGQPIDAIVVNDNGAFATREQLSLAEGGAGDRLKNKKLVVYEFTMRELTTGDWKLGLHAGAFAGPSS